MPERQQPVKMTEEQMDEVTAGLIAIGLKVRSSSVSSANAFAAGGRGSVAKASAYSRSSQSVRLTLIGF